MIVYGDSSDDGRAVAETLRRRGLHGDLRVLRGGFAAWEREGLACASGPCQDCPPRGLHGALADEHRLAVSLLWALRLGLGGALRRHRRLKLADPAAFALEIHNYQLFPALAPLLAATLPAVELASARRSSPARAPGSAPARSPRRR